MSVVVNTSLSTSGTPASDDGNDSPAATAASTLAASASACSSATCRNAWYLSSVWAICSRQARVASVDDTSLAAILAPSVAASSRITSLLMPRLPLAPVHARASLRSSLAVAFGDSCRLPQDSRDPEPAVDRLRRLRQRLFLGQARLDDVGAEHVDVGEGIVGGFDTSDV